MRPRYSNQPELPEEILQLEEDIKVLEWARERQKAVKDMPNGNLKTRVRSDIQRVLDAKPTQQVELLDATTDLKSEINLLSRNLKDLTLQRRLSSEDISLIRANLQDLEISLANYSTKVYHVSEWLNPNANKAYQSSGERYL